MSEQFGEIQNMMIGMLTSTTSSLIAFLPKLVGAALLLLIGWIIARLLRAVLVRSIRAGLDSLLERAGLMEALERASITATPSDIVSRVFYWLVMILFVMGSADIVGLSSVSGAITRIFSYIPSVISAALVLAAGVFLARFVGNIVASGAAAADLSYAKGLGAVANTSIAVMVGVVTIEQLGIDTQIVMTVITVTVAAITAGMGLAFALGSRDIVGAILAGHYLRQSLPQDESIEVSGRTGTVEQIGPISTTFRDGETRWSMPNSQLMKEIVRH
jgi:small-conductance mechanosensitive channel